MLKSIKHTLVLTLLLIGITTILPVNASAKSVKELDEKIKELEQDQNSVREKNGSLNEDKAKTTQEMNENTDKREHLEEQLGSLEKDLKDNETKISIKEEEIRKTAEEIKKLNEEIETLNAEIEELQQKIIKREEILANRLQAMQLSGGNIRYIDVLLGADSIDDFITRVTGVNTIMESDRNIMVELDKDRTELEKKKTMVNQKKDTVQSKKESLEQTKVELEQLKDALSEKKKTQDEILKKLEKEYEKLEEYKVSIEDEQVILKAQEEAIQKAISLAESEKQSIKDAERLKEEQRRASEKGSHSSPQAPSNPSIQSTPSAGGSGSFIWPAQGRLSSGYGQRWGKLHAGIDIANSVGTPVKAAASGVVISTNTEYDGRMNGYGNVILVAHSINGKTYTTLYAHLNSISVSSGQQVSSGQTIGTLGNTGQSTGPHLHFEVHVGGWNAAKSNSIDPMRVLP